MNPESIDEMADAILDLLGDERKEKQMGDNGRNMVERFFTEYRRRDG